MARGVKRREKLLRYLGEHSFAKVSELARRMRCSTVTIRRDLKYLEDKQRVIREDGGASLREAIKVEYLPASWAKDAWREKVAIGHAAAGLISPGERVLIGTGSTALAVAHELVTYHGITVLTTSLAVVSVLLEAPGVECQLVGGRTSRGLNDLFGPEVEEHLSRIHVDCAFVGTDAISAEGVLSAMHPCLRGVSRGIIDRLTSRVVGDVTRLMMKCADRVVLLMDSSKACEETTKRRLSWIRQQLMDSSNRPEEVISPYATLADIDCLITDSRIPIDVLEMAEKAGVRTIVVKAAK